jgi:hypothetical protein
MSTATRLLLSVAALAAGIGAAFVVLLLARSVLG